MKNKIRKKKMTKDEAREIFSSVSKRLAPVFREFQKMLDYASANAHRIIFR
jgi:hypothetical protein